MIRIVLIDSGEYLELSEMPALEYNSSLFRMDGHALNRSVGMTIPPTSHNAQVLSGAGLWGSDGSVVRSGWDAVLEGEGVSLQGTLYFSSYSPSTGWDVTLTYGENSPLKVISEAGILAPTSDIDIPWVLGRQRLGGIPTSDGDTLSVPRMGCPGYYISEETSGSSSETSIDGTLYDVIYSSLLGKWIAVGEQAVVASSDGASWEALARPSWTAWSIAETDTYLFVATSSGLYRSVDGVTWTSVYSGSYTRSSVAAGGKGDCVCFAGGETVVVSTGAITQAVSVSTKDTAGGVTAYGSVSYTDVIPSDSADAWGVLGTTVQVYISATVGTSSISVTTHTLVYSYLWYDKETAYTQEQSVYTSPDMLWSTNEPGTHRDGWAYTTGLYAKDEAINAEGQVLDEDGNVTYIQQQTIGLVWDSSTTWADGLHGYAEGMAVGDEGAAYYQGTERSTGGDAALYGIAHYGGMYVAVGEEGAIYATTTYGNTWTEGVLYTQTAGDIRPIPSICLPTLVSYALAWMGYDISWTTEQLTILRDYWVTLPGANDADGNQLEEYDNVYLMYNYPQIEIWDLVKTCAAIVGAAIVAEGTTVVLRDYKWSSGDILSGADIPTESEAEEVWYGVGEDGAQSNSISIERDDDSAETQVCEYTTSNASLSEEQELYEIPINGGAAYGVALVCDNIEVDEDDEGEVTYTYGGDSYLGYWPYRSATQGNTDAMLFISALPQNANLQAVYTYSRSARVRVWMQAWNFAALKEDTLIPLHGHYWSVENGDYQDGEAELTLVAVPSEDIVEE